MNVSRPFVRVSADGLWRSERTTNQKIEKNGLSSRSLITIGKARALSLFLALSRSVSFCFSRSFSFRLFLKSRYIYLILFSFAFHGNFTILSCINILIRFSFFPFQIECSRSFSRRPTRFSCSLSLSLTRYHFYGQRCFHVCLVLFYYHLMLERDLHYASTNNNNLLVPNSISTRLTGWLADWLPYSYTHSCNGNENVCLYVIFH